MGTITDLAFLREFCEGDKTRMTKYIDIYLKATPGNLEKVKDSLYTLNFEALARTVHSMKAHLNYMGMKETRDVAEKIELYAKEMNNLEQLPSLIDRLYKDFEISARELSSN